MHTTLGAPGSTGLVKVVNGIIQAPATLLVNEDVSDTAAISVSKISGAAPLASPTFTGTVTIPAGASISGFAPLASPTFTGAPLSTTAAVDTNTTQIATTAYVVGQGYAKLASPTFLGTPSLPTGTTGVTQSAGNNTNALATTAFVTTAVSGAGVPYDLSAASAGTYSNSQVIFRYIAPRAVTITSTGSYFKCVTASSGTVTAAVAQSGSASTSFNVTFSVAGGTTGSVPTGTTIAMAVGDILTVTMPASANSSLAGVYFTLKGTGV
jgi:hypothetical protein